MQLALDGVSAGSAMELKYKVIDLEYPFPVSPLFERHWEFSQAEALGFFDHFAGFGFVNAEAVNDPPINDFKTFLETIKKESVEKEDKLSFLIRRTAGLHEYRHFFDCFCTPIGFSLFEEYSGVYGHLSSLLINFLLWQKENKRNTNFPAYQEIKSGETPDSFKKWLNHLEYHLSSITMDIGPSPIATLEGHDFDNDFTIARGMTENGKQYLIPCVHINAIDEGNEVRFVWPVGFCLIAECLAVIDQGAIIGDYGFDNVIQFRQNFQKMGPNPYTALIGTLNRIMKSRGYIPHDRDHYRIAFRSLFIRVKDFINNHRRDKAPVGWSLLYVLENFVEIDQGNFKWTGPDIDRTEFAVHPQVSSEELPNSLIEYMRINYYNLAMTVDMQKVPLHYDSQFGTYYLKQPLRPPPVIMVSDNDIIINDVEYFMLWINWLFIREIVVAALWTGCFTCPVRHPSTSWLFNAKYTRPSGDLCDMHLSNLSCGIWLQQSSYTGPDCFWYQHMERIIFSRLNK